MRHPEPILIPTALFLELQGRLITLLESLAPEDWDRPTVCSRWSVKDIAAHLLDTALRRLSLHRDGYAPPRFPRGFESDRALADWLHRINAEWTDAAHRLSPPVLIGLLERAGAESAAFLGGLDPMGRALFPVAWAGESESRNWFDVAREYTERWHHHAQIIDAVGRESDIESRRLYHPTLDAFMRALPFTFRGTEAPEGMSVVVTIAGEAGGEWTVQRAAGGGGGGGGWRLWIGAGPGTPAARVVMDQGVAWRVFTKRRPAAESLERFPSVRIEGDQALGRRALEMVSIMA